MDEDDEALRGDEDEQDIDRDRWRWRFCRKVRRGRYESAVVAGAGLLPRHSNALDDGFRGYGGRVEVAEAAELAEVGRPRGPSPRRAAARLCSEVSSRPIARVLDTKCRRQPKRGVEGAVP